MTTETAPQTEITENIDEVEAVKALLTEAGVFGDIVKEPANNKQKATDDPVEDVVDETDEGTDDEDIDDGDETDEDEVEDDADEEEEVEVEVDTVAMAEALGLKEGDIQAKDGKLSIKTKVDGEVTMVPLERMRENYQLRKHIENKSTQMSEERKTHVKEIQEKTQALDEALQHAAAMTSLEMEELHKQAAGIDWDTLRTQDPANYSATVLEVQNREKAIQAKEGQIKHSMQQVKQEAEKQYGERLEEYKKEQRDLLMEQFPQWQNKETAQQETKELGEFARQAGFSDEEISQMYDHRIWALINKARLYQKGSNQAKSVKKNLQAKRDKKVLISANKSRKGAQNAGKTMKTKKLAARAMKSGRTEDQVAYVTNLLQNN